MVVIYYEEKLKTAGKPSVLDWYNNSIHIRIDSANLYRYALHTEIENGIGEIRLLEHQIIKLSKRKL